MPPMSRRTEKRKLLMRMIEDETFNQLKAEWRCEAAERGLPGDLALEARNQGRKRFERYLATR